MPDRNPRDEVLRKFGLSLLAPSDEEMQMADEIVRLRERVRELEAASEEPVAWALYDYDLTEVVSLTTVAQGAENWRLGYGYTRVVPLYHAPPSVAGVTVTEAMVVEAARRFDSAWDIASVMDEGLGLSPLLRCVPEIRTLCKAVRALDAEAKP